MLVEILLFAVGLILLYFGAEWLVGGSSAIALELGVKPLVVGLTVVAFGTSSPELLVCLTAAIEHTQATDSISIGNILGSNIANIALVLGVSALIKPVRVTKQAVRREYPLMLAASFLLVAVLAPDEYLFGADETLLSRVDGFLLAAGMAAYLAYSYFSAIFTEDDEEPAAVELDEVEEADDDSYSTAAQLAFVAVGIAALALGAYLMVESSVAIAKALNVPELVIGISIVAFGTSLPELATSVVAITRDESDISVGNVIGSNLFNILLVLGTVSLIAPIIVHDRVLQFDLWMMLGVAIGIWPILVSGRRINRLEGGLMLVVYAGYITLLFLR
jgi:cation:H+ antiporter